MRGEGDPVRDRVQEPDARAEAAALADALEDGEQTQHNLLSYIEQITGVSMFFFVRMANLR